MCFFDKEKPVMRRNHNMGRGRNNRLRTRIHKNMGIHKPAVNAYDAGYRYGNALQIADDTASPDEKIEALKNDARALERQLLMLAGQIKQIEQGQATMHAIPVVDIDKCNACSSCRDVCPEGAIHIDEYAEIDRSKCNACGICITECPEDAIYFTIA